MADARQRKIFWSVYIALFAVTLALPVLPVYKGHIFLGRFPLAWAYMTAWDYPTATDVLLAVALFAIQGSLSACVAAYVSRLIGPKQLGQ